MDAGGEFKKIENKRGPEARCHIAPDVSEIDLMNNSCGTY